MASYASSVDLENLLGVQFTTGDHVRADLLLELASGRIDTSLRQPLTQATETVTLDGTGTPILLLPTFPVTAVTSVVADGTPLVFDDDFWWSASGILTRVGGCWPGEPRSVVVNYTHGYAAIPASVKDAALKIAAIWWDNPLGLQSETIGGYSYRVASSEEATQVDDILAGIHDFALR